MKIGFALYDPVSGRNNRETALELVRLASEEGADIVFTPELATINQKHLKKRGTIEAKEQLGSFMELAGEFGNAAGVGFVEAQGEYLYNSYAIVMPEGIVFSRRKAVYEDSDSVLYLNTTEGVEAYKQTLKPNGTAIFVSASEKFNVLPLIGGEVFEDKSKILKPGEAFKNSNYKNPAEIVIVPRLESHQNSYLEDYQIVREQLVREGALKPKGILAYCNAFDSSAKIYLPDSNVLSSKVVGTKGVAIFELK